MVFIPSTFSHKQYLLHTTRGPETATGTKAVQSRTTFCSHAILQRIIITFCLVSERCCPSCQFASHFAVFQLHVLLHSPLIFPHANNYMLGIQQMFAFDKISIRRVCIRAHLKISLNRTDIWNIWMDLTSDAFDISPRQKAIFRETKVDTCGNDDRNVM